jgi:hypothetical protein
MIPTCPQCKRTVQSRALKHCSFCGKSLIEGGADYAQVAKTNMAAMIQENQTEEPTIDPITEVVTEIVNRGGSLQEVDELLSDRDVAAEAYGGVMARHHSIERARAVEKCDCTAPATHLLHYHWKTSDSVSRRPTWLTALLLPLGVIAWRREVTWVAFCTTHALCDPCATGIRKEWVSLPRVRNMGVALFLCAFGLFLAGTVDRSRWIYALSAVLLVVAVGALVRSANRSKLQLPEPLPMSPRCQVVAIEVEPKQTRLASAARYGD